jgi:hypothetical protein
MVSSDGHHLHIYQQYSEKNGQHSYIHYTYGEQSDGCHLHIYQQYSEKNGHHFSIYYLYGGVKNAIVKYVVSKDGHHLHIHYL